MCPNLWESNLNLNGWASTPQFRVWERILKSLREWKLITNATNKTLLINNKVRHVTVGLLKWIVVRQPDQEKLISWYESFSSHMNQMVKDKGLKQTVLVTKQLQLHLTRYLSGNPLYVNDLRIGLFPDGLPKLLRGENGFIRDRIKSRDPIWIRALLTIFSVTRVHLGDGSLTPSSIVDEASGDLSENERIMSWLRTSSFGSHLKDEFQVLLDKNKWNLPHLSTKAGPNGQAMGTSLRDLQLLPTWLRKDIEVLGGKALKDYLFTLGDSISTIPHWVEEKVSKKSFLRRLSVVRDKALKNRPIAIFDYWSQGALIGLHKSLMGILRNLSQDLTFNQMGIESFLGKWPSYHCLDLSSATDRFPVSLQENILSYLVSDQYAQAWRRIMVKLPFYYEGKEYTYKAGQPMGAYSSWAMFALSHHIVIQYCAYLNHINDYRDYAVLGDDVVIGHPEVANTYKKVIKNLGVEISASKTHEGLGLCEFAKNTWLIEGDKAINVTGVPLPGILESLGNPFLMSQELQKAVSKGTLDNTSVPVTESLLCFVEGWVNKRSRGRLVTLIQDWWACVEALNWVKCYQDNTSPRPLNCTRQPSSTYQFFISVLTEDIKEVLKKMRRDLIRNMQEADRKNNLLYEELLEYHESGPDRDSLPNLGGVFYQPWYWAMEYQVKLVDDAYVKVTGDRFSNDLAMSWEEIVTMISSLRISDPHRIDSRRTAEIVSSNKRKQFSLLLPYVRSQ